MADLPSISVVTICKNAASEIGRTLDSIAAQDYPRLEQVVVDGGSQDGTLAIVKRHAHRIRRFISEADRGIAHAFNKGIEASTGDWLLMLNAGDAFAGADALRRLAAGCARGARIVSGRSRCGRRAHPRYRVSEGMSLILRAHLSHQATLVHRDVYREHGGYDERYRVRMDTDFFLRVLPTERLAFVDEWVVEFLPGGISGREFWLNWTEARMAVIRNRCGVRARLEFEALFALVLAERTARRLLPFPAD